MSNAPSSQSIVLCEGYHDRAFWQGILEHLGCVIPNQIAGNPGEFRVLDPTGKRVVSGQYGYHTQTGAFVRVVPCKGQSNVLPEFRRLIRQRSLDPRLTRLIINVDTDINISAIESTAAGLRTQDVLREVQAMDGSATLEPKGEIVMDAGAARIALIRWETADVAAPGLPDQQTLERFVCATIVAAYPERGRCVQSWLDTRHEPPASGVKEFAWSHMAGWYPEHGCDDFYRCLWNDAKVAVELKARLESSGAWQMIQNLVS